MRVALQDRPDGRNDEVALQAGAGTISYDAKGDMTADGVGGVLTYNNHNWLTGSNNGASLVYDALGRLYSVTANGSTTDFLYDGSQLIGEYSSSSNVPRRYVPGDGPDNIVSWVDNTGLGRLALMPNDQGSIAAVANSTATVQAFNTYDDYGVPGPSNQGRIQYTGQVYLPEIGYYNYKARAYSPTLGRFLQTDPIGYQDGMNWYNYAHGNPVNGIDPSGMDGDCDLNDGACTPAGGNGADDGSLFTTYYPCINNVCRVTVTANRLSTAGSDGGASTPFVGRGFGDPHGGPDRPQNTVSEVVVTAKRRSQGIDLSKLGSCLGGSALDYYGLTGAAGVSGLLAIPIPKSIVPPFRSIGTPTTNLLSVLGHYVDISVPAVTIAGRTSTNLFRIAGRLNPYVAAGLFAVDAAVIGYDSYQCYNGQ